MRNNGFQKFSARILQSLIVLLLPLHLGAAGQGGFQGCQIGGNFGNQQQGLINQYGQGGADQLQFLGGGGAQIDGGDACGGPPGGGNAAPVIHVEAVDHGTAIGVVQSGHSLVYINVGTQIQAQWVDPWIGGLTVSGVTATDMEDGDLTEDIVFNPGNFPVFNGPDVVYSYDVQDSGGRAATTKYKTFRLNQAPVLNLNGGQALFNVSAGFEVTEAMVRNPVTASDELGDLTGQITITLDGDILSAGDFPITVGSGEVKNFELNVVDALGTPALTLIRTWQADLVNTPPTITTPGSAVQVASGTVMNIAFLESYVEIEDAEDGTPHIDLQPAHVTSGPLGQTVSNGGIYNFTFQYTDSGGLVANGAMTVEGPDENAIVLINPTNNQLGTPLPVELTWMTLEEISPSANFEWRVKADPNCSQGDAVVGSVQNNPGSLEQEVQVPQGLLANGVSYWWCVRSDAAGLTQWTSPYHFTTQEALIPTPNILVLPLTSAQNPSGQEEILIEGSNGEVGSFAYIYLLVGGQPQLLTGEGILIDNEGNFSFNYSVAGTDEPTQFQFVSRIKRGDSFGPYTTPASYYFDPALTVTPVTLKHYVPQTNGKMRWLPSPDAAVYEVWRRVGHELCDQGPQTCYLMSRPFKRIATVDAASAPMEGGHVIYQDPAYVSGAPDGSSYFVTVKNAEGSSSPRSNSISFEDSEIPVITATMAFHHIARPDGYNIDAFVCDTSLLYDSDNSADLVAYVQYAERDVGQSCDSFNYDSAATTSQQVYDSLIRNSYPSLGLEGCIIPISYVGLPGESYCARTCISDITSGEVTCSDGSSFNTPDDTTAPGFGGITNAIPQNDGFSALVQWEQAEASAPGVETIQYEVKYTNKVDAAGFPIFSGNSFIIEDEEMTEAVISDLNTGEKYWFEVNAIDTAGNRSGVDNFLDRNLLDNRPQIKGLSFDQVPNPHRPEQKKLTLSIVDREAIFGDTVALNKLEYRRPGEGWKAFDLATEVIINGNQLNSLYAASTPGETNETEFILDARQHFVKLSAGEIRVTVSDSHGLQTEKVVDVSLLKGASDYANYGAGNDGLGCSSSPLGSKTPWGDLVVVALLLSWAWMIGRRSSKQRV